MFTKKSLFVLLIALAMIVSACAPAKDNPVTLRLAVSDEKGYPSEPLVLEFINQVKTLSNGNINIEPIWDAGKDTEVGFEAGVIQLVKDGKADLGLAASRSFNSEGITSLEALQAPFLIDNDALAKAVATSDAASRMLENLSSSGLAGLTLWPEDLRHPFSVDPARPLLSPEDFAGLTVRVTDNGVSEMLIKALGGNPIFEASDYQGAEAGLRQGATLTGRPAATGNVTFFAKYQVLFANGAAFEKLSDTQRIVLHEAAKAAQKKALAERPSDVESGTAWCVDGGTVVLASNEQVAAFQKASQPVFDKLQENAFNAESIAALRELKAKTQPSQSAQACAPAATIPTQVSAENQTWSEGLPPNGTWMVELTIEDVVRMGVLKSNAEGWAGLSTYEFQDGEGSFHGEFLDGFVIDCPLTYEVVEDFFRITYVDLGLENYDCGEQVDDLQWRLDSDGLHFNVVAIHEGLLMENTALYEAKPWQKISDP
jgi:TRAP-type C4-dicarboxylate transport system substrate-binding protein